MIENVPRITSRGEFLLKQVKRLVGAHGYLFHEGFHDCGELGGLGQHRKRYLLIARLPEKMNSFIYRPPKRRVKSIGEVIGPMPMPDDRTAGPMHRLPRLKWLTWMRLALIPAGGDWRDLEKLAPEEYRLEYIPRGGGPFGVHEWRQPAGTVIGNASVKGSNAAAVADPRLGHEPREGVYKVQDWESDPRIPDNNDRPDPPPVIIALDGTWHRPLTTLELAALQGFPLTMPDGRPLALAGKSDARHRERIGNAVPPPAARAIAEQILTALLVSEEEDGWVLGATGVWVKNAVEEATTCQNTRRQ
jgi:site-specific DNA-cytosine methylase